MEFDEESIDEVIDVEPGVEVGYVQLPHSVSAERLLISSVVQDQGYLKDIETKEGDFFLNSHKILWGAIRNLDSRGMKIDLVTLVSELNSNGKLDEVGEQYVSGLFSTPVTQGGAKSYAEAVWKLSIERSMVQRAVEIQKIVGSKKTIDEKIGIYAKILKNDFFDAFDDKTQDSDDASLDFLSDILTNAPSGVPTGFNIFDGWEYGLGGFPIGVSLLIGDSSFGKTAWCLEICENVALSGSVALYLGYEGNNKQMVSRRVIGKSGVPLKKIRTGTLTEAEQEAIRVQIVGDPSKGVDGYQGKYKGRLKFNSTARSLIEIRRAIRKHKPRIVFIDQLRQISDKFSENVTVNMLTIFAELKAIAIEENCAIVCVHGTSPEESTKFIGNASNQNVVAGVKKEKMPNINSISWAKDLKYLTDVMLYLVPSVHNTSVAPNGGRNYVNKIVIWIMKDREGERFVPTFWDYNMVLQSWADKLPPYAKGKTSAQQPSQNSVLDFSEEPQQDDEPFSPTQEEPQTEEKIYETDEVVEMTKKIIQNNFSFGEDEIVEGGA